MSIKTIDVFLNMAGSKTLVGKLAEVDGKVYFEYEQAFLNSAIELSPYKLPLKPGVHRCEDTVFEGLYGLFADSLPDGWGRLLLDRHFLKQGIGYEKITPLDRLGYIGEYGMGALAYEPVIESIEHSDKVLELDALASASLKILEGSQEEMVETLLSLGGSSAGARPKAVIQFNEEERKIMHGAQSLQPGYEHYLVKFPASIDGKDIGVTEYIYARMAEDAGIETPKAVLLEGEKGKYFATKRFDRAGDERVHIHSVAGLTHTDFRMPVLDYDDLLTLTLHLTRDVNEQLKMFRLAAFNLFAHNRDDHAKNFSFLLDENYHWQLSPAYDLTFSYGPGEEHSTTYLGEGRAPTREHLLKLAQAHHIKGAKEIIEEIESVVMNFKTYAKTYGLSKSSTKKINDILTKRK